MSKLRLRLITVRVSTAKGVLDYQTEQELRDDELTEAGVEKVGPNQYLKCIDAQQVETVRHRQPSPSWDAPSLPTPV